MFKFSQTLISLSCRSQYFTIVLFLMQCSTAFLHSQKRSVLEVRGVLFLIKLIKINTNPSNIETT